MKPAFTLIELLVTIAIIGVLAAAVLVAINPGKRMAQARDAQRKQDISVIANALAGYYTLLLEYPGERRCDTSRGWSGGGSPTVDCSSPASPYNGWHPLGGSATTIYPKLVTGQGFLKKMPKDPINDSTYYYRYEPQNATGNCLQSSPSCDTYWIGARLEAIDNPADQGLVIFRCTDNTALDAGAGCKTAKLNSPCNFVLAFDADIASDSCISDEDPYP